MPSIASFRAAVLAASLTLSASAAHAGSVIQLSPERALAAADAVFEGTVESTRSYHFDGRSGAILTDYSVLVTRTVSDQGGELAARTKDQHIVLTFSGGRVGDIEDVVHGVPQFAIGERAFFLINRRDWSATSPIVGVWQGLYRVRDGKVTGIGAGGGCCGAERVVHNHFFAKTATAPEGFTPDEFADELARAMPIARRSVGAVEQVGVPPGSLDASGAVSIGPAEPASLAPVAGAISTPIRSADWLRPIQLPPLPASIINIDTPNDVNDVRTRLPDRYGFTRANPSVPITWNIAPGMGGFVPDVQNLLAYWNAHADIFRYYTNPTNTFTFGNFRYEMGFATSAVLQTQQGRNWNSGEIGLCSTRHIFNVPLESDIYFNFDAPNTWSSDYDLVAGASLSNPNCAGTCGIPNYFISVCLHELGHSFSLAHQWVPSPGSRFPSVMNYYSVNELFDTGFAFADDALAIRAAYPAVPMTNGLIKLWFNTGMLVFDSAGAPSNGRQFTLAATSVQRGSTLAIGSGSGASARFFTVENTGTIAISPRIDFYLTPNYNDFTGAIYVGTSYLPLTAGGSSGQFQRTVTIPSTIDPGQYFVAASMTVAGDENNFDNVAWNFNRITVTAGPPSNNAWTTPVTIDPRGGTYTGTTFGATNDFAGGCNSSASPDVWYLMTPANSGTLVLDTCGSSYDTVIEVLDQNFLNGTCNDDAISGPCAGGLQSRLLRTVTGGTLYRIRVSGYNGNLGNFTLHVALVPTNDGCWNTGTGGPFSGGPTATMTTGTSAFGTTVGASRTPAGTIPACPLLTLVGWATQEDHPDVWFRWTPACSQPASIATYSSSTFQIGVYSDCYYFSTFTGVAPQLVAFGAFEFGTFNPVVHFTPQAGVNYYIRVLTWDVDIDFRIIATQSIGNDSCPGNLVNISTSPAQVVCDNRCAAASAGGLAPPACGDAAGGGGFDMGPDVYHTLNIQTTGTLRVTRCDGTYSPVVALYPACPSGGTVEALACGYSSSSSCSPVIITHPVFAGQQLVMRTAGVPSAPTGVTTLTLAITPSVTGACCQLSGACAATASGDCTGVYSGDNTVCAPSPCPQPTGACCTGTVCSVVSAGACAAGGGSYSGNGRPCLGQPGNRITCCDANFNTEGGITVQDIFDFMTAYFSGDLRADINHSGTITVQDIFDFLAAYFAGCP